MAVRLVTFILLSGLLTGAVRHYSLRNKIIDIPNERSSHQVPTPSGGGLAFVALFLLAAMLLPIETNVRVALVGGGALVSLVGWLDDRFSLSAAVRFVVHVVAAAWALGWLGGLPRIELGVTSFSLGWLGWPVGVVGIVWLINLYNFMDGIDGLAGGQALIASLAGGALLYAGGHTGLAELSWVLSAVVLGFLFWNWHPAKIFMGDVASGFLGYTFAVLAISSDGQGGPPMLIWALLLGVFLVDATATLLRRIRRGERVHEAHRSHAYQLATQMGYSHRQVTMAAMAIMAGLALLAWVGWRWPEVQFVAAIIGFAGLAFGWCFVIVQPRDHSIRTGRPPTIAG